MYYFIADTHFGDKKIIDYEGRPFKNAEEMDEALIKNWNEVVSPDDTVFVLGDFSTYDVEKTKAICMQLRGKKILVKGNHDGETEETYRECGFVSAYDYPIIFEGFWMLSHEPLYINHSMPYANVYGHVHNCEMYVDHSAHSFCVSVERINYRPISWETMKDKMQKCQSN